MNRIVLLSLLALVLAACGGSSSSPTPVPTTDPLLTEANSFKGEFPADAQIVGPDEFRQGLASGDFSLVSTASLAAQKVAREKQFQDDRAYLNAVPDKSPYLAALLAQAAGLTGVDTDHPVSGPGGQPLLLLGLGTQLRDAVEAYSKSQDVGNALADYTLSYSLLPADLKAQADSPDSLKGAALGAVQAAATRLSALLAAVPNLDGTRPEAGSGGVQNTPGAVSAQTVNAGNGSDNNGPCTPTGLVKTYWFPLKNFVSPIKNQANRGTCWAFSAIGALESRERVQNNNPANLSEQFLVNKVKQDWDSSDDNDGYWSDKALQTAVSKGQILPSEAAWTYNPASGRPATTYDNTCAGYSGDCSDTAHESRRVCTTVIFKFCSYVTVRYSGSGVASSTTTQVWTSGKSFDLPRYRLLMSQGYTLLADFPVYEGFRGRVTADGKVSDYTQTMIDDKKMEVAGSYGGHAVQLVGFLSNDVLSQFGQVSKVGGGGYFILKNSWGCSAGDAGYYYVPADYVSRFFNTLRVLNFDNKRSDAWIKEQAVPGGTVGAGIVIKSNPARADLRVETDLAQFFTVSHPVAKSVNLTVTSDLDGTVYNGPWSTDTGALFGSSLKRTFTSQGTRTVTLVTSYGSAESRASFVINVVNTPPRLNLSYSGNPQQGEDYPITAQITDINESDLSKLCASTVWSVDVPDVLSVSSGCTVKVRFGAQGARQVRVSTRDAEGATDVQTLSLNVQPPPVNPYPRLKSSGMYSRQFVPNVLGVGVCGSASVNSGSTIDLRQTGCTLLPGGTPPLRYFAGSEVENPSSEALTYDWKFYVTNQTGDYNLYSSLASTTASFDLYSPGNTQAVTNDCRVTLKVNAPDPARSKGPITVWSGKCTYNATRLN